MFLKEFLEKLNFEKSQLTTTKDYPACKELKWFEIFLTDYSEVVKFQFQGLLVGNTLNKQC